MASKFSWLKSTLDYHVWGAMLDKFDKLKTQNHRQYQNWSEHCRQFGTTLSQDAICKAVLLFRKRLDACVKAGGGHFWTSAELGFELIRFCVITCWFTLIFSSWIWTLNKLLIWMTSWLTLKTCVIFSKIVIIFAKIILYNHKICKLCVKLSRL